MNLNRKLRKKLGGQAKIWGTMVHPGPPLRIATVGHQAPCKPFWFILDSRWRSCSTCRRFIIACYWVHYWQQTSYFQSFKLSYVLSSFSESCKGLF